MWGFVWDLALPNLCPQRSIESMWKMQMPGRGRRWGSQVDTACSLVLFPWWPCSENWASGLTCLFKLLIIVFLRKDGLSWVFDYLLRLPVLGRPHKCSEFQFSELQVGTLILPCPPHWVFVKQRGVLARARNLGYDRSAIQSFYFLQTSVSLPVKWS